MTTVHIDAQVSSDGLLEAVEQLDTTDLEQFLSQVIALNARRKAPSLPQAEAELLLQINRGIPGDSAQRYAQLIDKRRAESLTPAEHTELLRLGEQVEQIEVRRVECLAQLARLRQTSLTALMDSLGIRTPDYA